LNNSGCLALESTKTTLGEVLWSKLLQIGYLQINTMTNEHGETSFVMKPSALAKYVPSGLADMLDDAKALASSFTYGIVNTGKPSPPAPSAEPASVIVEQQPGLPLSVDDSDPQASDSNIAKKRRKR
jgi:hypothetical protein